MQQIAPPETSRSKNHLRTNDHLRIRQDLPRRGFDQRLPDSAVSQTTPPAAQSGRRHQPCAAAARDPTLCCSLESRQRSSVSKEACNDAWRLALRGVARRFSGPPHP
eukprot:scaffold378706_cov36-Prasinocladus_malaysianus.AAC.1